LALTAAGDCKGWRSSKRAARTDKDENSQHHARFMPFQNSIVTPEDEDGVGDVWFNPHDWNVGQCRQSPFRSETPDAVVRSFSAEMEAMRSITVFRMRKFDIQKQVMRSSTC
jgi:hypothetical protein